ncbi:hypothetical protein LR48_Vigan04g071400 [Vigna angularis]|uniref:Uncharacterized protein n=1 Tax=Phaseolus angularis TaxID=3914 RepID=A0A0L9UCV1_PHAAN|nr:hypothetical protein LR48_Vigan04g071400 [Vigna angularis]
MFCASLGFLSSSLGFFVFILRFAPFQSIPLHHISGGSFEESASRLRSLLGRSSIRMYCTFFLLDDFKNVVEGIRGVQNARNLRRRTPPKDTRITAPKPN